MPYELRDDPTDPMGTPLLRLLRACTLMARVTREEKDALNAQMYEPLRFYTRCATALKALFERQENGLKEYRLMQRMLINPNNSSYNSPNNPLI